MLWLDLSCFSAFILEEFMELVEDLGAKINKYSLINKYMDIFAI